MMIHQYGLPDASRVARMLEVLGLKPNEDLKFPMPNLRISTEETFWAYFNTWSPRLIAHAGKPIKFDNNWAHIQLFWYDVQDMRDSGFAVVHWYSGYPHVKYFTFGACVHEFKSKTIGNCLHRYTCSKCKVSYEMDTSG